MKRSLLIPLVLVAVFGLAGCDDKEAKVKDTGTPAQVEKTEPTEAVKETAKVGDLVEVGDWDVRVTKVVLDANSAIEKANEFNEKPKGQYVLVSFEATYNGSERTADIFSDLSWTVTGNDNQVNDSASAVTPADTAEVPTEARKGGTVKGQVVFDIATNLLTGATLSVEGYDADFDTVYADFAL
ncbi:putative lipoprotein YbaY [Aeromicrobium panaciterrae]|uniref:Lipoprotein YbaY n=1 Tax=Aeromicrobium panaciterrae TaxID=363861 RepID=A0ABU1UN28_9ACTN|nr:hypothetical protein [Aeromicrobium panaciterrae]MDR7086594.1 putative lipoprotein YbaY [Aeromicrobium panaciterrae]